MKPTPILASVALSALLVAASGASAAPVTVSQQSNVHVMYDVNNKNAWFATTQYSVGTKQVTNVAAGAFRLTATDAAGTAMDFLAFCLEPLEGLVHPKLHEYGSLFTAAITQRLNTLAANAWGMVSDHRTAAAFQMAAWEITTETANLYDVDDGHFRITGNGEMSNLAEETAQIWLNNLSDGTWGATDKSYVIFNSNGTQDLLTNVAVSPVPVPASGLMLMAALGAGGVLARRRAKKVA